MIDGAVHGSVRVWLRLEGLIAFGLATYLYANAGHSWLLFGALFFTPDVSFTAYLAGPRIGAAIYNAVHSYVGPLAVAAVLSTTAGAGLPFALIWGAHVGFDRALGYGLKYPTAFRDTHLGRIGRDPSK
jgi:hypothetical protein